MKKSLLSCAALCLLLISSCKKEDEPARRELLTSGKWRVTASKTYATIGNSTITTDEYLNYQDCQKDNLIIFRSDNHLIGDEGATKCIASSPQQSDGGIWSLTENDTKLLIVQGAFNESFKINTLNSSTFEFEYSDIDSSTSAMSRQVITFSNVN